MENTNPDLEDGLFDMIVLGSGPAGTAAALTAKGAGLKVCIVSKKSPVKEAKKQRPLQSIHPGVLPLLDQLGLKHVIDACSKSTFTGIEVNGQMNRLSPEQEEWYGHHIDRALFDEALLKSLKGCSLPVYHATLSQKDIVLHGERVTVKSATGLHLRSTYCIDATGYDRLSKRLLGIREKAYSLPLHCWTGVCKARALTQKEHGKTRFLSQNKGWLWTIPNDESALTWTKLTTEKNDEEMIPFGTQQQLCEVSAYNVRWRAFRPVCTRQVLLCGDAAGMVDPAAGQGILHALMSGIMVANCVISCIRQPHLKHYFYANYDQWFIQQFEDKMERLNEHYQALGLRVLSKGVPHDHN